MKNNNKHLELRNDDFKRRHLKDAEIRTRLEALADWLEGFLAAALQALNRKLRKTLWKKIL